MNKQMAKLAKMLGYSVFYHSPDSAHLYECKGSHEGYQHYNRENLSINLFEYIKNSTIKGS